jgi:hypothetical protein
MTRPNRLGFATVMASVGLGTLAVAAGYGQAPVPTADLPKLIQLERKHIDAELAKPSFLKKGQGRVKMAAFMIAAYAQNGKGDVVQRAALRDQALKLIKVAGTGKADEARKLAATLTMDYKGDPAAAHVAIVPLEKQLDLETVMRMFSGTKVGGFDLEKDIENLGEAKGLDAAQFEQAALLGDKVNMIGLIAHTYAPASDQGKKTKKAWNDIAAQMQNEASALAAAAHAKKDGDVAKSAKGLMGTCTRCHDIFR